MEWSKIRQVSGKLSRGKLDLITSCLFFQQNHRKIQQRKGGEDDGLVRSHAFEGPENQWSTDHDQKIPLLPSPSSCQSKPPLPLLLSPLFLLCLYPWVISVSQTKAKNTKEEEGELLLVGSTILHSLLFAVFACLTDR